MTDTIPAGTVTPRHSLVPRHNASHDETAGVA